MQVRSLNGLIESRFPAHRNVDVAQDYLRVALDGRTPNGMLIFTSRVDRSESLF
jgi:hypothetical protein